MSGTILVLIDFSYLTATEVNVDFVDIYLILALNRSYSYSNNKALKPIVFKITMMKNNLKQVDTEAFLLLEDDILAVYQKFAFFVNIFMQ